MSKEKQEDYASPQKASGTGRDEERDKRDHELNVKKLQGSFKILSILLIIIGGVFVITIAFAIWGCGAGNIEKDMYFFIHSTMSGVLAIVTLILGYVAGSSIK